MDTAQAQDPVRFQILGDFNWGHRLAEVYDAGSPILENYLGELKDGLSFGMTAGGFFWGKYGAGFHVNRFAASHEDPNITLTLQSGQRLQGISDDITMWFLGPVLMEKHEFAKNRGLVIFETGFGYLAYSDEAWMGNQSADITASTLSFMGAVKVAARNSARGALGIQFRILLGNFDSQEVNGVETKLPEKESVNRFDLGLVLGFAA